MAKKTNFGPDFDLFGPQIVLWVLPLLIVRHCSKLSLVLILAHFAQIQAAKNFFSKIWLCQSPDVMVTYHHGQYQKKTKDSILRKLCEERTDGETDRQIERRARAIS